METQIREICRLAESWRQKTRKGPFEPLKDCVGFGFESLDDLGKLVDRSKQPSTDQKKAMSGVRRSGIVEIAIQHLLAMARNWESDERKAASDHDIECSLLSIAFAFKQTTRASHFDLRPFIDEEDATKIFATIYEVSTMFRFERDTVGAFPTFIFADAVWLLVRSFPTLPFPDVGVHLLQSYVPMQTLKFKKVNLPDAFLHEILDRGTWNRGFETIAEFILKHEPSAFNVAPEQMWRFSFRRIVHQLARWAVANVDRIKADYAEDPAPEASVNLLVWCFNALQGLNDEKDPEQAVFCLWTALCLASLCPFDARTLAHYEVSAVLFIPMLWNGWTMYREHELDRAMSRLAIQRMIDVAAIPDGPFDSNVQSWVKAFLLVPGSERVGAVFSGLPNLFEHHDPESVILRRALCFPGAFANALLGYDIHVSSTKIHHIMAFALMCQTEAYSRGSREPFISQFVEALQEKEDTAEKVKRRQILLDAVHYACALFASQDFMYKYDEGVPLKCLFCDKAICDDAQTCSACRLAPYCSPECQREHWPCHKDQCGLLTEFKGWIAEQAPKAKQSVFADQICFGCGTVRGPALHVAGAHGRWPSQVVNEKTMSRCARCKQTSYCSKECQVKHWKAGHKEECTATTK